MTVLVRAPRPTARAVLVTASATGGRAAAGPRPAPSGPPLAVGRTRSVRPAAHATSPPMAHPGAPSGHARRCGRCAATTRTPPPPRPLPQPTVRVRRAALGTTTTAPARSHNRGPCSATTSAGAPPATPQPDRPSHTAHRPPSRCGPPAGRTAGSKPRPLVHLERGRRNHPRR